jgi:hypothetical protein
VLLALGHQCLGELGEVLSVAQPFRKMPVHGDPS